MISRRKESLPVLQVITELHKSISEWIGNADFKATAILTLNGVIIALLSTRTHDFKEILLKTSCSNPVTTTATLSFGLYLITFAVSLFFVFRTLLPDVKERTSSPFFFGSIAKMSLQAFQKHMSTLNENKALDSLTEQIHINSAIASSKFHSLKRSIQFLFLSLFFLIFFLLVTAVV